MDLKQFYYYIAIAEECSLSKASERLYVSQPALSRFISKLEMSLNAILFIRSRNNSLVITEAGLELLEYCRRAVNEYESLSKKLSEYNPDAMQHLSCGITGEKGMQSLTPVLIELVKRHPNVNIDFVRRPNDELFEMIHKGELDIASCAYHEQNPKMNYTLLGKRKVDLIVPLNHPLAARGSAVASDDMATVSPDELRDESFVMLSHSTALRKIVDRWLEQNNIKPKACIEVATSLSAVAIVESGLAIGFIPRRYESINVRFLQLDPPLYQSRGLIYRKDKYMSQVKTDFIRLCKERREQCGEY